MGDIMDKGKPESPQAREKRIIQKEADLHIHLGEETRRGDQLREAGADDEILQNQSRIEGDVWIKHRNTRHSLEGLGVVEKDGIMIYHPSGR